MANHKSVIKRHRQSEDNLTYNRWWKSRVRNASKELLVAVEQNDAKKAKELLVNFTREIDKASSKGVYHKKTASRKVSRLAGRVAGISS